MFDDYIDDYHTPAPPLPPQTLSPPPRAFYCYINDDDEPIDDYDDYYKINPPKIDYDEVDELEVKLLFRKYVESTWFWRKDLVKNIETFMYEKVSCYYINVMSYYEIRQIRTEMKQYAGLSIDSKTRDNIDIYDYEVDYPEMFEDTVQYYTLPHTERIIICNKCDGNGKILCEMCKNGYVECEYCQPPNSPHFLYPMACRDCMGSGRKMCRDCSGTGRKICAKCVGSGKRIAYDELCINYYTLNQEEAVNPTRLHSSKLNSSDGIMMIDVEDERLRHFEWSKYPMINDKINRLLRDADISINKWEGRLIDQRAVIKMIPVSHIETTMDYDIYCIGVKKKLESPNYPSNCNIM